MKLEAHLPDYMTNPTETLVNQVLPDSQLLLVFNLLTQQLSPAQDKESQAQVMILEWLSQDTEQLEEEIQLDLECLLPTNQLEEPQEESVLLN